jgi:hypothetical protein
VSSDRWRRVPRRVSVFSAGGWPAKRTALVAINALTSIALLAFIHVNGRAPDGDYSKSYARQIQELRPEFHRENR